MGQEQAGLRLRDSYTGLTFKLFDELNRANPDKNLIFSPFSIASFLLMLLVGAGGQTRKALAGLLQVNPDEVEALGAEHKKLVQYWVEQIRAPQDSEAQLPANILESASSIWTLKNFSVNPAYAKAIADYFAAEIMQGLMSGGSAVAAVNQWVSQKTHGLIENVISQLDPRAATILINAIYFKASWQLPFEARDTKIEPFHRLDGSNVAHPFMRRSANFIHYADDKVEAIVLPYASSNLAYVALLPKDGTFQKFAEGFSVERWAGLQRSLRQSKGEIVFPKHRISFKTSLTQTMKALGAGSLFDPAQADFSGISEAEKFWLDELLHAAVIDVDEKGTEAAAVTMGVMLTGMMAPPKPWRMVVDRPFYYLIIDWRLGIPLFAGKVTDPTAG